MNLVGGPGAFGVRRSMPDASLKTAEKGENRNEWLSEAALP